MAENGGFEDEFELTAYLEREDPRDAIVAPGIKSLDDLPRGARVGTSSLRRQIQLKALRPDLEMVPARGNVNTRLAKLDGGDFDALVLAAAGLKRLSLSERVDLLLSPEDSLPAAGQGIIAVECLADSKVVQWVRAIDDAESRRVALAERHVCRRLDASCSIPLAVYAQATDGELTLRSRLGSLSGEIIAAEGHGEEPIAVADQVADDLFAAGASRILREFADEVDS